MNKIELTILEALKIFKPKEILTGSQWADKYYYLSSESSSQSGKWTTLPVQRAILDMMTDDRCEQVNLLKSRRFGYTEILKAAIGYFIEQKFRNVIIWQPTNDNASDFVSDSIDPMIRDVIVLGECFKGASDVKSKYNTCRKKVFKGCVLDIKGGTTPGNYRRMTKEVACYDEVDAFDADIGGEGNCFELGDGRLDDAAFPKSIRGGTPGLKGISLIEPAVLESDIILERYIPCVHCGHNHVLRKKNLNIDTAEFVCPSCNQQMIYKDFAAMDNQGYWASEEGIRYDEELRKFFDDAGNEFPFPRKVGFKVWAAYSYLKPWSFFCEKWAEASRRAKTGDPTVLKSVVNTLLAETWEEKHEKTNESVFESLICDYNWECIPNDVLVITCGVDIQGGKHARIEMEFLGHGLNDQTWSIDYVVLEGDTTQDEIFTALDEQFQRIFEREDGRTIAVSAAFVDSGYLTDHIYRYCAPRRKFNIFPTKGVVTGSIPNKATWQGDAKTGTRCLLRSVNVEDCKTIFYNRANSVTESGKCHFPNNYPKKYYSQLANEEKRAKMIKGRLVGYSWQIVTQYIGNEPVDCRCYAMGAFNYLNINMSKAKERM